jgi:hypothetical protein
MKLDPYLTAYTKSNSKWVKDLRARPKNAKPLAKNLWQKLYGIEFGSEF